MSRLIGALLPPPGAGRRLAGATFVSTVGNGLYLAGGAIFLTRSAGLPAGEVGLGLTLAGLTALGFGVIVGEQVDRRGVRGIAVVSLCVEGGAMAAFAFVHAFGLFLLAALVGQLGESASQTSRSAAIAQIGGEAGRVHLKAQLRALTNLGISIGALLAGLALAADTRGGYVAMILGDAVSFWLAAFLIAGLPLLPATRAVAAAGERRWIALADRPYLVMTALNAIVAINYGLLTVGVPLWIAQDTNAPRWLVAPLLLVNTIAIVALQVRASVAVGTPTRAAATLRRGALLFPLAWVLVALAGGAPVALTITLLVLAVAVHTGGELLTAAASFELSFSLADPRAQGQYQGAFGLGFGLAKAVTPLLATAVAVGLGFGGWIALGLLVAAGGALAPASTAWALRVRRPADADLPVVVAGGGG